MTLRVRIIKTAAALVLGTLSVLPAVPVAAGGEDMLGYGPHTADVGLHWLLDAPEAAPEHTPVVCRYDATTEEFVRLLIRQPVMFADVSGGPRTQRVGWRAVVQRSDDVNGPWKAFDRTPIAVSDATGRYPADFRPQTIHLPANVELFHRYRVEYRLFWYARNGTTVADRATHRPAFYGLTKPGASPSYLSDHCESEWGSVTAGAYSGDHSGHPGLHWILDHVGPDPEFPAASCTYDDQGRLTRIHIRRPILFARDTGAGVQRGDVAWKVIIEATPQNNDNETWSYLAETSTTRRSATDVAWADLLPKAYDVADDEPAIGLRVIYRLTWFKGSTNTVTGGADHLPKWYGLQYDGGESDWEDDYCHVVSHN